MLLTVDTSLGDAILARYGGFVYSISDGAQMLLLQHPDAPSPPPPALRIAETVWNIQNCLEQNNLFTLNLNLSFLQRLVAAAAAPAAMLAVRSRMLTERALWTRAPSDGESRVLQTAAPRPLEAAEAGEARGARPLPVEKIHAGILPPALPTPGQAVARILALRGHTALLPASPGRASAPLPAKTDGKPGGEAAPGGRERKTLRFLERRSLAERQVSAIRQRFTVFNQEKRGPAGSPPVRQHRFPPAARVRPAPLYDSEAPGRRQDGTNLPAPPAVPGSPLQPFWQTPVAPAAVPPPRAEPPTGRGLPGTPPASPLPAALPPAAERREARAARPAELPAPTPARLLWPRAASEPPQAERAARREPPEAPVPARPVPEERARQPRAAQREPAEVPAPLPRAAERASAQPAAQRTPNRILPAPTLPRQIGRADAPEAPAFAPVRQADQPAPAPALHPIQRTREPSAVSPFFPAQPMRASARPTRPADTPGSPGPAAPQRLLTRRPAYPMEPSAAPVLPAAPHLPAPAPMAEPAPKARARSVTELSRPAQPAFGPAPIILRAEPPAIRQAAAETDSPDIPTVRTRRVETETEVRTTLNRAVNASQGELPGPDGRALTKAVEEALAHLDLRKLSDRVYRDLESRLRSEKARRGQW